MAATGRDIPGPGGGAFGGTDSAYERDRVGFLRRCQRQYGDVFRFGADVVVCDPELANRVLVDTGGQFRAEATLLPDARLTSGGALAEWLQAREVISDGLPGPVLAAHAGRLDVILRTTLAGLAGRTVPGMSAMQRLSAAAIADCCLGGAGATDTALADTGPAGTGPADTGPADTALADTALAGAVGESALALIAVLDHGLRLPRWIPDPRRRRLRVADRAVSAGLARAVAERIAAPRPGTPADLLDLVLANDHADRATAARAMATTLAGSHAVPGTALSWLLATVAEHPDTYQRIRAEATELLPAAIATGDPDLLPYTAATVREVLRLFPPTWLLGRQATGTVELGGWQLAAGQQVVFSPYLIHRDRRSWADPDEFRPERFLDADPPRTGYLPFGAGPRGCLGTRLALLHLTMTVALVARDYRLTCSPSPVQPRFTTLLAPTELRLRLTPDQARRPTEPPRPATP